jgi:peptidoglycan L-alanyl-D-glutamate endopeptidase CwlK
LNRLGRKSKSELCIPDTFVVHPYLVICIADALQHCFLNDVDFAVFDGGRTYTEQAEYFRIGTSKTMDSNHLPRGECKLVYAADLVPIVDGNLSWDDTNPKTVNAYYTIADGMKTSADNHAVDVEWGFELWGWDMPHWQLNRRSHP